MKKYIALLALLSCSTFAADNVDRSRIHWQPYTDEVFAQAEREHRFVLLDLEAVWCHWCHVMDEQTYADPAVIALVNEKYIAVRVDQDSRPDLSHRYEDYGWPATVVFNAGATEIVKRRGYIPALGMSSMLQAIVDDPSPVPGLAIKEVHDFAEQALLRSSDKQQLETALTDSFDFKLGGLKTPQKFLDRDTMEYVLSRAVNGDTVARKMLILSLDANLKLLDPAWGGAYQYSVDGNWNTPHYEKIMSFQADDMRLYALSYSLTQDQRYLHAARAIHDYLNSFLRAPTGAYYTSQDADLVAGVHSESYFHLGDKARRQKGIPRIDTHVYSRENGMAIRALTALYSATGDAKYRDEAEQAAQWVMAHRRRDDNGFKHDDSDNAGPYLDDNLAMGRALLSLYTVTGHRHYLQEALNTADFIADHFTQTGAGYLPNPVQGALAPHASIDDNIGLVQWFSALANVSGKSVYHEHAEHAMRFLAAPEIATSRLSDPGILLADAMINHDALHITIVGHKDDAAAGVLFQSALAYPSLHRNIEWWDKREGSLLNNDVQYPELDQAAAFICTNGTCSLPIFSAAAITQKISRLEQVKLN